MRIVRFASGIVAPIGGFLNPTVSPTPQAARLKQDGDQGSGSPENCNNEKGGTQRKALRLKFRRLWRGIG
jgi:hypothetical protein